VIGSSGNVRVLVATKPVDFRKGAGGERRRGEIIDPRILQALRRERLHRCGRRGTAAARKWRGLSIS
jgi:hypothetical protein